MSDSTLQPADSPREDDPRPLPPEPPAPGECCESGCLPCVHDLYSEAMANYRDALRAWEARHAGVEQAN